ncbi:MAG: sorbitol dehydrogenase [Chloroflexi bacterium]|nr:MAG: sorbitol dehydrogenase [Chloroflexota bacterium]
MFSVAVTEPGKIELVQIPCPEPGPYEALIRTEVACLCNATDRKLVEGHFPGVETYPLLLGHEAAGIVLRIGPKVRSFKAGDRVIGGLLLKPTNPAYASGWGGFSEYTLAGDHRAMVEDGVAAPEHGHAEVFEIMRPVPPDIPVEAAVLLCTWREVYAAFGDFNLQAGQNILVVGAGPVGLSFVNFARLLGLGDIGVVESLEEKRALALRMGASEVFAPEDMEAIGKKWAGKLDAVIDAVGRESIINSALPLVKLGGSICVYGVIDQPVIQLRKHEGPYNFNLLVHQWPTRFREAAAQEPLCEWIRQGKISHTEFISAEFPIQQINEAFAFSRTGKPIKTLLRY